MAKKKIVELLSITSASGWFFEDSSATTWSELDAVACFAVVSYIDLAYPDFGYKKGIVPLYAGDILSVSTLMQKIHTVDM